MGRENQGASASPTSERRYSNSSVSVRPISGRRVWVHVSVSLCMPTWSHISKRLSFLTDCSFFQVCCCFPCPFAANLGKYLHI